MSDRVSDVFHYDGLAYWGPIDSARMERLIDLLALAPGDRALDVGCGRGELLVRLAERCGADGLGVDRSRAALAMARAAAAERAPTATLRFVEADAATFAPDPAGFAAVMWLGGPLLGADFAATLTTLASWVRPGGSLLVGHGFWRQPPPAEYLAATGIPADEFTDHCGNLELARRCGLRSTYCGVSSRDEWDLFEGTILHNVERYAAAHPDAPDPHGRLEQRRTWHEAQQRWGRDTMGFGLYVLRKDEARAPAPR